MQIRFLVSSLLMVLMSGIVALSTATACGGVTALIVEKVPTEGVRQTKGPNDLIFYYDAAGHALLPAAAVKVNSALAEAVARRYLVQHHGGNYGHLEFEGFVYEHGDFVYMYHADVPALAYSVHIGPVSYVSGHAHIHVSATSGDVYGPGCGLGSGTVVMPFEPQAYSADLRDKRLPYVQFDTHFLVRDGVSPRIDGVIEPQEWNGAGHTALTVGTAQKQVHEYG